MPGQADPNAGAVPFSASGMNPRQEMAGQNTMMPDPQSPEGMMSKYLQEMQAAQKQQQMMKMAAMVQGMGQGPQNMGQAPPPGVPPPQGGGYQGPSQGGPGQQLQGMLGKARGIGGGGMAGMGMPGAPMGYPGGVPGAATGGGASPANMLQQLAMRRQAGPRY